jgi:glutamate racemase
MLYSIPWSKTFIDSKSEPTMRSFFFHLGLLMMLVPLVMAESPSAHAPLAEWAIHPNHQEQPHTFRPSDYEQANPQLPIGVFDSGIGGLTVLEAILSLDAFNNQTLEPKPDGQLDFANETFIYLGDQANMPYGNYPTHEKVDFLRELIGKDAIFLMGRRYWATPNASMPQFDKLPVKAIVIACNTATAYGLNDVRDLAQQNRVSPPVIGVVEAAARSVAEQLDDARSQSQRAVGILATVGTCSSLAYPKSITAVSGLAGKKIPTMVQQGSVNLASAIESQPELIETSIRLDLKALLEAHRLAGVSQPLDTIVLGCTHFPLVINEIRAELEKLRATPENGSQPFRELIAPEVTFVNPAELTAKELFRELARQRLRNRSNKQTVDHKRFFISVASPTLDKQLLTADGNLTTEYKYGRRDGKLAIEDTRCVPMTKALLPPASLSLIEKHLPHVWALFQASAAE